MNRKQVMKAGRTEFVGELMESKIKNPLRQEEGCSRFGYI
jgi:hypothetical protein